MMEKETTKPTNKPEESENTLPSGTEKESKKAVSAQTTSDTSKALTEALAKKDEEIKKLKEAHNSDLQKAKEQQETFEKRRKEQEIKQETFEKRLKEQEAKLEAKEKEIKDIYIKNNHTSRPPTTKPKTNKQTNFSRNPVNRVVGTTASIVGGVGSFIHRRNAKMQEIGAEPSQLFMKSFWKDIGHNIKKTPKQIGKTVTAGFRKHEQPTEMKNTQKTYTPSRSWTATKGQPFYKRIPKAARRLARKPIKISHRAIQVAENVIGDTFDIIKNTKISGNPKKWNLWQPKKWNLKKKFTRTRRSRHMLTHRDGKKTEKAKF